MSNDPENLTLSWFTQVALDGNRPSSVWCMQNLGYKALKPSRGGYMVNNKKDQHTREHEVTNFSIIDCSWGVKSAKTYL